MLALCLSFEAGMLCYADETTDVMREGESVTLVVGIGGGTSPYQFQWHKNGIPIPGANEPFLVFPSIRPSDAGSYTVTVSNDAGDNTSPPEIIEVEGAKPSRITNASIVATTDEHVIVGFGLGGHATTEPASILTRAAGPALAAFGVTGALPDPVLSLFAGENRVALNDNWAGDEVVARTANAAGAFAFLPASNDSALVLSLVPASYSARVHDASGSAGTTLIELYDTDAAFSATRSRLVNLSARGLVGASATLTAGFTIEGEAAVTLLLRGVGPTLTRFGVTNAVNNPRLALFRSSTSIATNENWGDTQAKFVTAATNAVAAFALPAGSTDAAIVLSLPPGSYSLQLSGANATSGTALIEIYEIPAGADVFR
jgi:hypothetical protein